MNKSPSQSHAASVVAQSKKDRVPGLGRGPGSKSQLQSPRSLKILQVNINGITTPATKIKLDQILGIAEQHKVQIIAIQETKLRTSTSLKIPGYNIYRTDRKNKNGGGLLFLIRDSTYHSISTCGLFSSESSLEIQGIRITWRGKPLNILNMYHPPDSKSLPDELPDLFQANTICIGDLNAKHQDWGSTSSNSRGTELANMIDDSGFLILNDGSPTHQSFSYDTREALDLAFASPDLSPSCKWKVLENIGSDHLPILIELNRRQPVLRNRRKFWNFKRANWKLYANLTAEMITAKPLVDNLETNWVSFKEIIKNSARHSIPRGNFKKRNPFITSKSTSL